mmetsp:Transcript_28716/g.72998  ORF Transcript_28716/g.72998 Transcript_28716/m.72998 type:complete len:284 (-) Transcript_28716:799-1650(-)
MLLQLRQDAWRLAMQCTTATSLLTHTMRGCYPKPGRGVSIFPFLALPHQPNCRTCQSAHTFDYWCIRVNTRPTHTKKPGHPTGPNVTARHSSDSAHAAADDDADDRTQLSTGAYHNCAGSERPPHLSCTARVTAGPLAGCHSRAAVTARQRTGCDTRGAAEMRWALGAGTVVIGARAKLCTIISVIISGCMGGVAAVPGCDVWTRWVSWFLGVGWACVYSYTPVVECVGGLARSAVWLMWQGKKGEDTDPSAWFGVAAPHCVCEQACGSRALHGKAPCVLPQL